jgi:serine/threonine protein phosphatase 1
MKYIVFGDIHAFPAAASSAVHFAQNNQITAIFLGDYIDRGPQNMQTLKILSTAAIDNPDWSFIVGNHDKMLIDLINGKSHPEGWDERTKMESFPEFGNLDARERKKITDFLNNLSPYKELNSFLCLHGGFLAPVDKPLMDRDLDELVWTYGIPKEYKGKTVVRGHEPTKEIAFLKNNININTECGYGGFLTGLVIDDGCGSIINHIKILESGELLC